MTVHLPSDGSTALPYHWTAVIHSAYLAQLSAAALHQPSMLLPFSPLLPGCVGHSPSLTSSAARLAAAVQPNLKHTQPQGFTKHPFGLSVQCNLLRHGTVTALTELVAGTARMHTCLNRIQQLMKQQQQQLNRRHLKQLQTGPGQNTRAGQGPGIALKQQPGLGQAAGAGQDSETGQDTRAGQDMRAGQDSAAGQQTRAGQRQLAWHVVSSAAVQLKQIGLTFATLEVRPPPPWNSKVLQVWCHMLAFLSKDWLKLISDMILCSRNTECTLCHAALIPMANMYIP